VTITVTCYSWAPSSGDHLFTCDAIYRPPHYVCSCVIRWWWQTCSFFVYVGKMLFFDRASKITYHISFTILYCKSV